jgi:hypothetical protein
MIKIEEMCIPSSIYSKSDMTACTTVFPFIKIKMIKYVSTFNTKESIIDAKH